MKKYYLMLILVLGFLISSLSVNAWLDCTPAACSSGYTDNGVTCLGGECTRNCTIFTCDTNWMQVHSVTNFGINEFDQDEASADSSTYTPTNMSFCYNFTYRGPRASTSEIMMSVNDNPPTDCDSEAIGGMLQGSSPWFSGMSIYVGSQTNLFASYMTRSVRAHAEADSDATYETNGAGIGSIYCAPNSVACNYFNASVCDTDCYNAATQARVVQGYYESPSGNADTNLYAGDRCSDIYVTRNLMNPANFTVFQANASIIKFGETSCSRTNEAPTAVSVKVLFSTPTTGENLLCNYTYSDVENFTEQSSSYQWWRNNVNQNINNSLLNKENLTANDIWYCKVLPSDGLLNGTLVNSSSAVTVASTVQNPVLFVNGTPAWSFSGYFDGPEIVQNFNRELNDALDNCVADAQGYCNVDLTFYSSAVGNLSLSHIGIYYDLPANESEARNAIEEGIANSVLSLYPTYTDQKLYIRYINGTQMAGTFDKVVVNESQTWAFNYITSGENFTNIVSLYNSSLVIWENESLATTDIAFQIKNLINTTKW
ncbi:MAG: hypothetical protein Q8R37_05990 [Nanoarchaeota archaeon]|nr:hypothetical protein [Nanoarchaeota archaeon]